MIDTGERLSLTLVLLLFFSFPATAQTIVEFHALYSASANGISGHASRSLTENSSDGFQFSSELVAEVAGIEVARLKESSHLRIENGQIKPHRYQFEMSGLRDKYSQITFDWDSGIAVNSGSAVSTSAILTSGTQDPLSYQLQLQLSNALLVDTNETFELSIVDDDSIDTQTFAVVAQESISTQLGILDCIVVERVERARSEDDKKSTRIWFAKDYSHLMAKLEQITANGLRINLEIESAQINGNQIGQ